MQLNLVTPSLYLSGNVAVVGSSHVLHKQAAGQIIDGFDEVIRFNRAPTEGWEQLVGSKTTLRAVGYTVYMERDDLFGEGINFVRKLRNQRILVFGSRHNRLRRNDVDKHNRVFMAHALVQNRILKRWMKRRTRIIIHEPSTGFRMVAMLVMSGIRPVLFGWSGDLSRYNYDRTGHKGAHNLTKEYNAIRELHKKRKLILW